MTRTRVGFVGAGIIAERHLRDLLECEDVAVVALADPRGERARELAQRCNARVYPDHQAMLAAEDLDAAYICVPPFAHGGSEAALIERRIPFFVEKPLSIAYADAERTADAIDRADLVTAVGYHWRYLDTVERAQRLLAERPARLALGYWLDSTPPPAWWSVEAQSGGQFVEQTTHIFDLARLLVGEVESVQAMAERTPRAAYPDADVAEASVAMLRFASGAIGSIASTCLLNWPHRIGLHLFCDGMAIELSEFDLMVDVGNGRPLQRAEGDPFAREDRDFIDAVQGKPNRIRAPYAEALRTHRLATTTAARAARAGETMPVMTS
ncbi:MAG TPA: Gfo/Idh/MocA family oxidoreductase [Thermomicrobiales bacterium]|nr:Gfo/Idh/MocA family oxidoreductase [Thermomicrobiales bacterium]